MLKKKGSGYVGLHVHFAISEQTESVNSICEDGKATPSSREAARKWRSLGNLRGQGAVFWKKSCKFVDGFVRAIPYVCNLWYAARTDEACNWLKWYTQIGKAELADVIKQIKFHLKEV